MKIENFFNQFIFDGESGGFIYHDIEIAINYKINFLVSLGLICYSEFLGGLMPKLKNEKRITSRSKFNRFFYRLDYPSYRYSFFDEMLKTHYGSRYDIYSIFRCGLVHEYFIKPLAFNTKGKTKLKSGSIIVRDALPEGVIAFGQTSDGRLGMAYRTYFRDFKILLMQWRDKLFFEKDSDWIKSFNDGYL